MFLFLLIYIFMDHGMVTLTDFQIMTNLINGLWNLKEIAIKEGFRTMSDMGRELILSGDLNFREFDRVLSME